MAKNLCLEIQPDCYTVVVGPSFATKVVKEILDDGDEVKLPTFEFRSIVDHGVSYLLDKETFTSDTEREKFEARYKNAYELDPGFVLRKIISNLQTAGYYKEWLAELFACNIHARKESKSLQCLLTLQSRGALLVYVHCDDIIARVAGLEPVLLENEKQMEQWVKGECPGFLQLHGVYSKPDTVQLDCQLYDSAPHPLHASMQRLKQFLCNRSTILLGDDWDRLSSEPLLSNFCERFVNESTERHSFISSTADTSLPALPIRPISTVLPSTEHSAKLWKQIGVLPTSPSQSCQHQVVCLLVSSQDGARDISHMMFNAPGVNFALVSPVVYGNSPAFCVSIRVASDSLHQLWHWLVSSSQEALLAHGLIALALQGGTFLWLKDPSTIINGGKGHCTTLSSADRNVTSTSSPRVSAQDISSSHPPIGGELRPNRIIERYKVVKKRNQIVGGAHSDMGPYGSHFMSKAADDPSLLLSHHAAHSKYARRGSLPPMKCGEAGNALALLADRLQTSSDGGSSQMPSYVAIKRALLSDKFKHMQSPISRLVVPKMLLNLLQAKKLSVIEEKPNLLAHRRNSDPGSYLQHRDKARRRQLFLDENLLWSKTYGSVIEKKIQSWKQKRLLRMQRDYFYSQQKELHLMNSAAAASQLVPSPLCSSLASSTNSSSLPQAYVAGINGFSPAPLMYQLPSTGLTPASVLVPSPFISPYAFMGSYTTLPVTAATQPTATYIVPPTALTAGTQQKVVFLPPTSSPMGTGDSTPTTNAPDSIPDTKPPFSSLLAPMPLHTPYIKPQPETRQQTSPQPSNSLGSRKRKSTVPEKLSSLLQPPSEHNPDSPPPATKKFCNTSHSSATYTAQNSSPSSHSHSLSHTHDQQKHHSSHSHHHRHRHRHRHHNHHHSRHSSSTDSHHHYYSSHSNHCHSSPSPPPQHPHSHNSPSPLEQCLLQPSQSPKSTGESPEGSPCSFSSSSPTDCSGRDHPQLWQFLLELLLNADCSHLIEWTDSVQEYEFTIRDPVQVAQLWGKCTNNSAMNYDKLARGLRYYYSKGIIGKVDGKALTFQYNGLAKSYVQRRCGKAVDVMSSVEEMVVVE